jgi:hypothetical protein
LFQGHLSPLVREFPFELALCAHLEATGERIVGRQIGGAVHAPSNRIVDVLVVEPGPQLDERTALTAETIPAAAIESEVGVGKARDWRTAFDTHPDHARRVVERAVEVGFFERERRGGREYVRQVARYPHWYDRLVGIENKPDLGTPGDLETQLRKDVSLGLLDEVVLATESYVTRAHLNRIPDEVGVWQVDADAPPDERVTVVREATPLAPGDPGVELLDTTPARTDIRVVTPEEKARKRRRMAERAYGKGWRTYDLPACGAADPDDAGLPYCAWKDRVVNPANCGRDCPGHDPADPADVDLDAEREARTPWTATPAGKARRQAGLDRFGRDD